MLRTLLAALAAIPFAATATAQTTHTIGLLPISFDTPNIEIEVGDTVDWVWITGFHNVVSGVGSSDGIFSSGAPISQSGLVFSVTFDEAFLAANPRPGNVYPYLCDVHVGFGMIGEIDVRQPLEADVSELSVSAGGTQTFSLNPTPSQAGDFYFLTGTTSGTLPGIVLDGVSVPINIDPYTLAVLSPNPLLTPNFGVITPNPTVSLNIPAGISSALIGTTFDHAWVQLDATGLTVEFASNTVSTVLIP